MISEEMMRVINNNPEMMKIINDYSDNENKKLKRICHKIWHGKVEVSEYDDLYEVAMDCLMEAVVSFDQNKSRFETFLTGNIARKTSTWMRDNKYRLKRQNLLRDENWKIDS